MDIGAALGPAHHRGLNVIEQAVGQVRPQRAGNAVGVVSLKQPAAPVLQGGGVSCGWRVIAVQENGRAGMLAGFNLVVNVVETRVQPAVDQVGNRVSADALVSAGGQWLAAQVAQNALAWSWVAGGVDEIVAACAEQDGVKLPVKGVPQPLPEIWIEALIDAANGVAKSGEIDEQAVVAQRVHGRRQLCQQRRLGYRTSVHPGVAFDQEAVLECFRSQAVVELLLKIIAVDDEAWHSVAPSEKECSLRLNPRRQPLRCHPQAG